VQQRQDIIMQQALILALGYSLVTGLSLSLGLPAIYTVLLSAGLLVLFYALLSWRSYSERERFIAGLRPFVASPQLYSGLLGPASPSGLPDVQEIFEELCEGILQARLAFLAPIGPLKTLFGPPLSQPPGAALPDLEQIIPRFTPAELCLPLRAEEFGGAIWAVPLWNERGLCGALLLGEKQDGGFYTQEEIEIARSASERLLSSWYWVW
jgi:hypothetical protein